MSIKQARDPLAVSFAVWRAIFLREAVHRLFDMRAAWFWLLAEPAMHIGFLAFVFSVIRMRTVDNADVVVWIIAGMLTFFFFRRTAVQVSYAADSSKSLFTYRQIKPFDPAIVRGVLEGFLMTLVSIIILLIAGLLEHDTVPYDPLLVLASVFGLWLFSLGYGLCASVLMESIPESEHVLKIIMMPLYLVSGVIFPLSHIPQPYLGYLLYNPIAHAVELARVGFFPYYHGLPGVSLSYVYGWAVGSIFLGLLLFRRFERQLVMR